MTNRPITKQATALRYQVARAAKSNASNAHRQMALRSIRVAITLEADGSPEGAESWFQRARFHAQFVIAD